MYDYFCEKIIKIRWDVSEDMFEREREKESVCVCVCNGNTE